MHIIYLAGNNPSNKAWIEKVKSEFDSFSTGDILYYDHWQSGEKWINLEKESKKLTELVKDKTDYFVFSKSIGSVLALKNVFEKNSFGFAALFFHFLSAHLIKIDHIGHGRTGVVCIVGHWAFPPKDLSEDLCHSLNGELFSLSHPIGPASAQKIQRLKTQDFGGPQTQPLPVAADLAPQDVPQ